MPVANQNEQPIVDRLTRPPSPVQDEWGVFDPEQAGLAAVVRKLANERDRRSEAPARPAHPRSA